MVVDFGLVPTVVALIIQMSLFRKSMVVDSSTNVVWPDSRTSLLGLRPLSQSQSSARSRLRNDNYYPPDCSFAATKQEKASP